MNSTPSRNAVNGALHEDYLEKMLASPPKPIPDLRLEAKMTAEVGHSSFTLHGMVVDYYNFYALP